MELLNKVKDYLTKEKRYDFSDEKWTDEMNVLLYDAVYAAEAVMSENKSSKWISVEDRLPELCEDGSWPRLLTINIKGDCGIFYFDTEYRSFTAPLYDPQITHWMPLPSPPQQ